MSLTNLVYCIGAFYFDYGITHVKNPRWPPHARFHNGQTMTLGVLLTSMSMYLLARPAVSKSQAKDNVILAALVGAMYCSAGLSAILYPGTDWSDPEYKDPGQKYLFAALVLANFLAATAECARLEHAWRPSKLPRKA